MLLFKKKFIQPILSGEKTQTIRLWRKSRVHTGQRSYIPGVGYIMIDSVEPVQLDALDNDDAKLDGFPDADALRTELHELYENEIQKGFQAFRVQFTRLPEEEQVRITQERKAIKEKEQKSKSRKKKRTHYEKTMDKLKSMVENAEKRNK